MYKKYYTLQEITSMRVYELPNCIYERVMDALRKQYKVLTKRMVELFNNATLDQLDAHIAIWDIISVIA